MKHLHYLLALATALLLHTAAQAKSDLVPIPDQVTWQDGTYSLSATPSISYAKADLKEAAQYLSSSLARLQGKQATTQPGKGGDIRLSLGYKGAPGSYRLTIDGSGVQIDGRDYAGVVNGIATLRQMAAEPRLQYVRITDSPRFSWRGFHLDCSRHFFTKAEVKEVIDLMAMYKLNRFHWHLTDDQGWRIEIKKYPLLTEKGAWRHYNNQDSVCMRLAVTEDNPMRLLPAKNLRVNGTDTVYGGYYTQDDIREIVAYARQRGVETVPEIDMPGHFLSAVANYPGLSCFDEVGWGAVFSSPLCPGKDKALQFCRDIWDEVIALFPFTYVHIGGDEVEKINWKKCPDCQRRIQEKKLKDEEQLQSWFIHEMEAYINKKGRKMLGWDEIIEGGLSKTATLTWWRTWAPNAIGDATAQGNDVIYCPISPFYFSAGEEKTSLQSVYEYELMPSTLSAAQKKHILGVQGQAWSEWIPTRERLLYTYFPRALALAELAWSKPERKDYADFYNRLTSHFRLLNRLGVPYRTPSLDGFYGVNAFTHKGTLTVTSKDPMVQVRYTTDGSFPTKESPRYEGPITVDETTHFMLRTFTPDGQPGETVKAEMVKQGLLEPVAVSSETEPGLIAAWHEFPGVKCALIDKAPVNGTYCIDEVGIPDGVKGNIGLIITGYIDIPADGIYTFALMSDDGSWLKVDGNMVVDNDREQSPHEEVCQQALRRGLHRVEVRYFDHNGGMLRLKVTDAQGKAVKAWLRDK